MLNVHFKVLFLVSCSCQDKTARDQLKLLCDLYALDRIWQDIGTYRNQDYVAPNKAKVRRKSDVIYLLGMHAWIWRFIKST